MNILKALNNFQQTVLLVLVLLLSHNQAMANSELMEGFTLGQYDVGFRIETLTDDSRQIGSHARTIDLSIWYPGVVKSEHKPMYFVDYLYASEQLVNNGHDIQISEAEILKKYVDSRLKKLAIEPNQLMNQLRALKTIAQSEIPAIETNKPILIFAPGGNTPGYLHSVMAEFLASHGYMVVAFPTKGSVAGERWPFDQIGLELLMGDMSTIIKKLSIDEKNKNENKYILLSWSVGGVAQAMFSMKRNDIKAMISLDSGIGRVYGVEMIADSKNHDLSQFTIPYLHFTGQAPEMYEVERSTEFIDGISSEIRQSKYIKAFAHHHFASSIGLIPAILGGKNEPNIKSAYIDMSNQVLAFIESL